MPKIKFGVIGLKGIGKTHVSEIATIENTELIAVADIDERVGKTLAEKYNVAYYKNYEDMLAMKDLDAVSICTPHFLHFPMAMKSFEYGKHVLIEKPMAITVKEADLMIEEAKKRGLKLGVVYQWRINPVFQKIKEMIDNGVIGAVYRACMETCSFRTQVYYARDAWRGKWLTEGGGVLINQAIHHIDLFWWLIGRPVKVFGHIGKLYHDIEVEDIASATIIFEHGAHGVIQASTVDPITTVRFEICGEKGKILSEEGSGQIMYALFERTLKEYLMDKNIWPKIMYQWNHLEIENRVAGHREIIRDFAEAIIRDREPLISGEEGRVSLEIVNAIILSSFEEKAITLPINREVYEELIKKKLSGKVQ